MDQGVALHGYAMLRHATHLENPQALGEALNISASFLALPSWALRLKMTGDLKDDLPEAIIWEMYLDVFS